jgi:hypothetical protein
MRVPQFLSPSSLGRWEASRRDFYITYLASAKPPRLPQTLPMAIGSAFDAFCKAALFKRFYGLTDPDFNLDTLLQAQVEKQHRDEAYAAGKHVFTFYQASGAFDALLKLIDASRAEPQFEFQVSAPVCGIPLLGKPDCRFMTKEGVHVILDWKLNGYCGKYTTSPNKYYCELYTQKGKKGAHKGYQPMPFNGIDIHAGWLEDSNEDWASQLATYGWLMGEQVGDENVVVAIEQVVCTPTDTIPDLRVASFRSRISKAYQESLLRRYQQCWMAIESGHIFQDKSRDESDELMRVLENAARAAAEDTPIGRFVNGFVRRR